MNREKARDFLLNITKNTHTLQKNTSNLHHLLEHFRTGLSSSEKRKISKEIIEINIVKEYFEWNDFHVQQWKSGCSTILAITGKLYGITQLKLIDISLWLDIKAEITKDNFWSIRIGHRFCESSRLLGKLFSAIHNNDNCLFSNISDRKKYIGHVAPDISVSKRGTGITFFIRANPEYNKWYDLQSQYWNTTLKKSDKTFRAAYYLFLKFVQESTGITEPLLFFSKKRKDFYEWLIRNHEKDQVRYAKTMQQFSKWFVNEYLTDKDGDEICHLGFHLFTEERLNNILDITNYNHNNSSLSESPKNILPLKYIALCKNILQENDFAWPKSLEFEYFKTNSSETIWCPVHTFIFLIMLEIPLRRIQVKLLDSGEGDTSKWNGSEWVPNNHPCAGIWGRREQKVTERGFLNPSTSQNNAVDLYVNTNKTADASVGYGEQAGYRIPWQNTEVIRLSNLMREWQEQYNPVIKPKSAIDMPPYVFPSGYSKPVLEITPDRFYLFRSPLQNDKEAPSTDAKQLKFWYHLMFELENRLKKLGDNITIIQRFDTRLARIEPQNPIFTPHGLRVTGLTALMEHGVPIEILSKIVAGHAAVLITLHYIKYNNCHITEILNEAQKKIEDSQQENFTKWLKSASWGEALEQSVFNDPSSLECTWNKHASNELFENRQCGICPNSGTLCSTGGEIKRTNADGKGKNVHGEVRGGKGNCINCRYFITGLPFLLPLWIKANELLTQARYLSEELSQTSEKLQSLKDERFRLIKQEGTSAITPDLKARIHQQESNLSRLSYKLDDKCLDAHRAKILVDSVRALLGNNNSNFKKGLMLTLEQKDLDVSYHQTSNLRQLDFMVQAGKIYDHIDTREMEKDRNLFVDTILFNSGMEPITLSKLSAAEKKLALDAAAKFLTTSLSDNELNQLTSNSIGLHQLNLSNEDFSIFTQKLKFSDNFNAE